MLVSLVASVASNKKQVGRRSLLDRVEWTGSHKAIEQFLVKETSLSVKIQFLGPILDNNKSISKSGRHRAVRTRGVVPLSLFHFRHTFSRVQPRRLAIRIFVFLSMQRALSEQHFGCASITEAWSNTKADRIGTSRPTINKSRERSGDGLATWIPGHANLSGDERADKPAKEGAELPRAREESWMTLARARRWRKEWFSSRFEACWKQQRKPNHLGKQLETSKPWKSKQYRSLNRVSVDVSSQTWGFRRLS